MTRRGASTVRRGAVVAAVLSSLVAAQAAFGQQASPKAPPQAGPDRPDAPPPAEGAEPGPESAPASEGNEPSTPRERAEGGAPSEATGGPEPASEEGEAQPGVIIVSGYLQPEAHMYYQPFAVPFYRLQLGAERTKAGLVFEGQPFRHFTYRLELVFGNALVQAVTGVSAVDRNGDGVPDDVHTVKANLLSDFVEELSVNYEPVSWLRARLGQIRIPFTVEQMTANTSLMFPERAGPNEEFIHGSDFGALLTASFAHQKYRFSAGVFNGTRFDIVGSPTHGVLYALRADVSPVGSIAFTECDFDRGPFRASVGAGLMYYPADIYDANGYLSSRARDLKLTASVRVAVRGLFVQAEVLRSQQTDDVSSRPEVATGAYGQASFYAPIAPHYGFAPIGRFGWYEQDEGFAPRTILWTEIGLALYIDRDADGPDALKLVITYSGQFHTTEGDQAHGVVAQLQMRF